MPSWIIGHGSYGSSLSTSSADAVDLVLGNRRRLALERDDVDDAGALQDRQALARIEAREAVAGKQRPVDLLLAILPAAPARDRRQEGLDVLLLELLADDLLVARPRPDRVPADVRIGCTRDPAVQARSASRSSADQLSPALPVSLERLPALGERLFVGLLQLVVLPVDGRLRAQLLEVLLRLAAPLLLR